MRWLWCKRWLRWVAALFGHDKRSLFCVIVDDGIRRTFVIMLVVYAG